MRAFALEELGAPGSVVEVPVPEPAEGQVRIRVAAAGLNPFDNAVIQGSLKDQMEHRFPLIPGMDAAGTVDALGEGVIELAIGDEVFGSVGKRHLGEGTAAGSATMSTATIARRPAGIADTDAAAIPVAGVTALTMVETASVSDGDVVVAIGATGGVGSYLVQLAASAAPGCSRSPAPRTPTTRARSEPPKPSTTTPATSSRPSGRSPPRGSM